MKLVLSIILNDYSKKILDQDKNSENNILSLTECRISSGHHEIYAMHSFGDQVCFDNTRLKVVQTQFGSSVGFNFRSFLKYYLNLKEQI